MGKGCLFIRHGCIFIFICEILLDGHVPSMQIDEEETHHQLKTNTTSMPSSLKLKKGRGFQETHKLSEIKDDPTQYDTLEEGEAQTDLVQKSVEGYVVLFTNIHEEATEEDMMDVFSEFGKVSNIHLNLDRRSGFVKGYVLVEYKTFEEARKAVVGLRGQRILDREVQGDFAFSRSSMKGRAFVF
ncbi:RNA-binding protein 8A [Coelomomyces lativittatus]|nr:RNA-binding protein 8A [Coelomomyces lativittatus]